MNDVNEKTKELIQHQAIIEKKIQDIENLFNTDDYNSDKALSGEFLIGYHCQLKSFRKNSDDSSEEDMED